MTDLYSQFKQALADEQLIALATVVSGSGIGEKLLIWPDGRSAGQLTAEGVQAAVLAKAKQLLIAQQSELVAFEQADEVVTLFIEVHSPPPKLIMIGAVHVAIPLASYGKTLGFRTIVIDARGVFATEERFPHVDDLIIGWPSEVLAGLNLNESTCITFLTHDEKFDNPGLEVALKSSTRYIGALGSTRTHAKRIVALKEMGLTDDQLERIYAPIGLNLGGRRPEEIAVSIIAQIVAVMNGKA